MKKFTPSIMIWNLELYDMEDGTVYQNFYFLSYKRAKEFWKKHEIAFNLREYNVRLVGEVLLLW